MAARAQVEAARLLRTRGGQADALQTRELFVWGGGILYGTDAHASPTWATRKRPAPSLGLCPRCWRQTRPID